MDASQLDERLRCYSRRPLSSPFTTKVPKSRTGQSTCRPMCAPHHLTWPLGARLSVAVMVTPTFRVADVCRSTGTSRKALRGYEELGLVVPRRDANDYRVYDDHHVRLVAEIRRLAHVGIPLTGMRPFIDCLNAGSEHADACPASLSEYRRAVERMDSTIRDLTARREAVVANLTAASGRMIASMRPVDTANPDLVLPDDLPSPVDDGAVDHLPGRRLPSLRLRSTDGDDVDLRDLDCGRVLIYVFPMTGAPGQDMPEGWDAIPGARGCSPQNCDIRNHFAELVQHGVNRVYGLSNQPAEYQRDLAEALRLPYPLLTDEALRLSDDPGLPTFSAGGLTLFSRQTLLLRDGTIEHVFYPVFPPDRHARVVLDYLATH
jgi:peroxiredoxin/DNA-binding transcriptional MerR regulator